MNLQFLNVNGYDENKIILDTLMGLDTEMYGIGKIRPIKIKDYELFKNSYSMYILTNYEHLELDRNENLLNALIGANTYKHAVIRTENEKTMGGAFAIIDPFAEEKPIEPIADDQVKAIYEVVGLLELLFGVPVEIDEETGSFKLIYEESSVFISNKDFLILREIVQVQNCLKETKKYEDKIVEEWTNRAREARMRKDITFADILVTVKNSNKMSYAEVLDMNVLQFYSDYRWCNHMADYEAITLFRTVNDKLKPVQFVDSIIKDLYKDDEESLSMDLNSFTKKLG